MGGLECRKGVGSGNAAQDTTPAAWTEDPNLHLPTQKLLGQERDEMMAQTLNVRTDLVLRPEIRYPVSAPFR